MEVPLGLEPSVNTVRNLRRNLRLEQYPVGRGMNALLARMNKYPSEHTYVMYVLDEREMDETRNIHNQVVIVVVLGIRDALQRATENPTFGCDGTLDDVCSY